MDQLREHWRTVERRMPSIEDSEYSVDGLSHLLGIPRDIILHEITTGELKAQRSAGHTVCIERSDVVDWLSRRGPGV